MFRCGAIHLTHSQNGLLYGRQFETLRVDAGDQAESFDGEVVVFALGEAGDGDGADDSCAGDVDGKAASVRCVVGVEKVVTFSEVKVV